MFFRYLKILYFVQSRAWWLYLMVKNFIFTSFPVVPQSPSYHETTLYHGTVNLTNLSENFKHFNVPQKGWSGWPPRLLNFRLKIRWPTVSGMQRDAQMFWHFHNLLKILTKKPRICQESKNIQNVSNLFLAYKWLSRNK